MKDKEQLKTYEFQGHCTYGNLFLCVVSIFTMTFIGYLCFSGYVLRKSQQEIKDAYVEHIQKADNLYFDLAAYHKVMMEDVMAVNSFVFADSLLNSWWRNGRNLSDRQYADLSLLITEHFRKIESIQERYESKICRDSLRLSTERCLLEGQTKTLLDLCLNKVDHEYSNITIWAAILTILFLVFSFYSIFKMDELIKQGRDGVREISQHRRNGEELVAKTKRK